MDSQEIQDAKHDVNLLFRSYYDFDDRYKNEQWAVSTNNESVVIAIAGSNDTIDWAQNFTAWWLWIPTKRIPGTKWKATRGYVQAAINVIEKIEPQYSKTVPLRFTGHSKGAAVACIVSIMLKAQGYRVEPPRTFAGPKFSMQSINDRLLFAGSRYVAVGDVVPDYPQPSDRRPWRHFGHKYVIGSIVDDYPGVIRDGVKAHLIANYVKAVEAL